MSFFNITIRESQIILQEILFQVMSDPVVAADGHSYDRICIEQWFRHNNRSPMNNTVLKSKKLLPNYTLKKCILEWNTLKSILPN